jgi:hypothetical protein
MNSHAFITPWSTTSVCPPEKSTTLAKASKQNKGVQEQSTSTSACNDDNDIHSIKLVQQAGTSSAQLRKTNRHSYLFGTHSHGDARTTAGVGNIEMCKATPYLYDK